MKISAYGSVPFDFDRFDCVPDPIVLHIFNKISDVKTLIRCRSVSKRFNSLVPQVDSVILQVDRVISVNDSGEEDGDSFFLAFLRSIVKSVHNLISPNKSPVSVFNNPTRTQNSPIQILRGFENIRGLQIELPSGDLRLEKGTTIKWKAQFGNTLKSCVILGFRGGPEADFGGAGLKMRVVWTISALIAASARHYMMVDVVKEQKDLVNLMVKDKDNEGTVVMDKIGLKEYKEKEGGDKEEEEMNSNNNANNRVADVWWKSNRTRVPAVRMRMRHEAKIELSNGVKLEGATLVVVRPIGGGGVCGGERISETEEQSGDVGLAMGAFGGDPMYGEAVERLLKSRSYILEMNSF